MLTFKWKALTKDGRCLPQFAADGIENSFGLVQELEREGNLRQLQLICVEDNLAHFVVDLETGYFIIRGGSFHPYISLTLEKDVNWRVVYFARNRARNEPIDPHRKGTRFKTVQWTHQFGLGWQCTIKGQNYQKIMFYNPQTSDIDISGKR